MATDFERPEPALVQRAGTYPSATLHEAMGRKGALPSAIKPVARGMRLCGPAFTVEARPLNNINIHRAIARAVPGDVLVVSVGGAYEGGYFGEIMAHGAATRRLGGLVIDGCVRDADLLEEIGFPVFARGLAIRGTLKEEGGSLNQAITVGDVTVRPGDIVVGDRDGVVVVPREDVGSALATAQAREEKEAEVIEQIRAGKTTVEIYGWSRGGTSA
jgi:4-hydroxy-4-methyl-2-oxoglutarate aldolase